MMVVKKLYPITKAYNSGHLTVSKIHKIWYAEYGNPKGMPVIVFHGGPGAGCHENNVCFFNPLIWRIILLDQRGAGRSLPAAEIEENTTQELISDFEKLRHKLGIGSWLIFAGSWGTALALAYSEEHPHRVLGLILRGVFTALPEETQNLWFGTRRIFPDAWQELRDYLPEVERDELINSYHKRVISEDLQVALPAATAFMKYDLTCGYLNISKRTLNTLLADEKMVLGIARLYLHYCVNNYFLVENQLLDNLHKITHLPLIISHGRYDLLTLPESAYQLHELWPGSELEFVSACGHSANEKPLQKKLLLAVQRMEILLGTSF